MGGSGLPVYVLLIGGLALLTGGAELFVRSASKLALRLGISALVVGLTVVAFGTSAPELAVSISSAARGSADLAVGNVVGSNIFNFLFILGLSAMLAPLVVETRLVRLELPLLLGASLLLWAMAADGRVGRIEGGVLFAGIVGYTVWGIRESRRETARVAAEYDRELDAPAGRRSSIVLDLAGLAAGLGLLVLGADWLVQGAVITARRFGLSELVIGLTVIAAGTSLPEVATSVMAALRGEREIAVGNVVGSNLFNILCVLGGSSVVSAEGLPVAAAAVRFDLPVMIAVTVAALPIFWTGGSITRGEGALLFGYYLAYVAWLVLTAERHPWVEPFSAGMLWFVLPLTGLGLGLSVAAARRARRDAGVRADR